MSEKHLRKARLANMDIEEVSYVDKAANKRKFLFVKRDSSEDRKDGENLELLKRFRGDKEIIKAIEGIDAQMAVLKGRIAKALEADDLPDDERELLLSKKEELDLIVEDVEEQFEHLFLDKTEKAAKKKGKKPAFMADDEDKDEEEDEDEDDEEVEKEDESEPTDEEVADDDETSDEEAPDEEAAAKKKAKKAKKKKAGVKKAAPKASDEDEETESDEDEESEDEDAEQLKKGDSDDEDDDDDDAEDSELPPEEEELLKSIQAESAALAKDMKETKELLSK